MNCHASSSGLTRTREWVPQSHVRLHVEKVGSALMLYRLEEVKLICDFCKKPVVHGLLWCVAVFRALTY